MSDPTMPRPSRPPGAAGATGAWQRLQAWLAEPDTLAAGHLPRFFLLFLLLFGVGMILISLVGDQGLIAYYGLRREARTLRSDVTALEAQRVELTRQIEALRDDPEYIAALARRRLGLVKPGETVLQLPPAGSAR
jgi:cell division protein FtsB